MRDDKVLLVSGDGLVEDMRIVVLVRRREVILMELDRHPDSRCHDFSQKVHVGEHPLVAHRCDPEVALKERVQAVQEELHRREELVGRDAEGSAAEQTESEAERDEGRVPAVIGNVGLRRRDVGVAAAATLGAVADPLVVDAAERLTGDPG